MQILHHIVFSRVLAVVTFCMFLVLTPRAWVEAEQGAAPEEVPVNVLDAPADGECLWCDPLPSAEPCSDKPQQHTKRRIWLNPDQPVVGPVDVPCYEPEDNPES